MGKVVNKRIVFLNFLVFWQRRLITLKKQMRFWLKSGRPYLAAKYWLIYVSVFILGFYLWGPAHGIQKVRNWKPFQTGGRRINTIEALQREIEFLKQEIQKQQTVSEKVNASKFNPDSFSQPALGQKLHGYNWINTNNTWRLHAGIDIGALPGSNVMAAAEGVVEQVIEVPGEGFSVTLHHGSGWQSIYANLNEILVKEGDKVIKGMIIGTSGSRSCASEKPGFHFGIYHDGRPVDPEKIIQGLNK